MYKIAVLSFSNPFVDTQDGGKIDIKSRLNCLKKLDVRVDHYSLLKKGEKPIDHKGLVENNFIDVIINKLTYIFSKEPISLKNRYSKKLYKQFMENEYDFCILENFNMFSYVRELSSNTKIFLRVHNIESLSRLQLFKSNPFSIKGFLELIESFKYKRIEKQSLKCVDKFLFISKDEMRYFEENYPEYKEKYEWIPPLANSKKVLNDYDCELEQYILYYGDLTVSHNIIGINRFVENVYKDLYKEKNIKFKIAGKIKDSDKVLLNSYQGIEVLGYVDDLDKCIANSKFIVAPIYTGAGVKIKVIDAISKGKVLITTPKGIEGTGLEKNKTALSAETYSEYYDYCVEALEGSINIEEVTVRGYRHIEKFFSEEYVKERFKEIFNGK